MTVSDIGTRAVITADPDETVVETARDGSATEH
jgi:hypothetical protein